MSPPEETRAETLARLQRAASDLQARNQSQLAQELAGQQAAGQAWKIIADLFGGVFVGLAVGFGVDHFAGTRPVGIIGGVLLGFALSVWMAWRTAQRIMAEAKASGVQPQAAPLDEDDDA